MTTPVFCNTDCCIKDPDEAAEDDDGPEGTRRDQRSDECQLFYDTCGDCGGTNMTGQCNPDGVFWLRLCVAFMGCLVPAHVCLCTWIILELLKQHQPGVRGRLASRSDPGREGGGGVKKK